jgi:pilus assembly protein CpaB
MDKKKLALLLGTTVFAVVSALAARSMLSSTPTPVVAASIIPQQEGPKVLVAQRALPVGTIITADAVNFQAWPKDMVQDAYFVDGKIDRNKLMGTVVRYPVTAGQPLTQGALVAPGDRGFLAAALGPGMRAITIPVSDMTGVAGFIFPGDHVDLMLTQSVKGTGNQADLKTTETVLRNLRVLATDQTTDSEVVNGKTVVKPGHAVTLEVTPRIAEKIEVAQTIGSLSLALRSIADNQSDLDKAIAEGTVKVPNGTNKTEEDKFLTQAMNKPIEGATTFSTGGDVSRFQRRTIPADLSRGGAPGGGGLVSAAPAGGGMSPGAIMGPTVKVVRGSDVTAVPVGRNAGSNMQVSVKTTTTTAAGGE